MNHDLSIDPVYLEQKLSGDKLFEIRNNDRGYQKGDTVTYKSYPSLSVVVKHTFEIIYISNYCQPHNQIVFGERFLSSDIK